MNLQETVTLIETLRIYGVTKFKSHEHDIELKADGSSIQKSALPTEIKTPEQAKAVEKANQKIKTMINTLQMTPEQLADQIFPAGAGV